jgi:hypothetical protein
MPVMARLSDEKSFATVRVKDQAVVICAAAFRNRKPGVGNGDFSSRLPQGLVHKYSGHLLGKIPGSKSDSKQRSRAGCGVCALEGCPASLDTRPLKTARPWRG